MKLFCCSLDSLKQESFPIQELSASSPAITGINIEYVTANSSSMFGIFPTLAPQHISGSAKTLASSYLDGVFAQTAASTYITVGIDAVDYVDFKAVDSRIEHRGGWTEIYPMGTSIAIPTQHAEEILNKLKQHRDITSVGSELTARGICYLQLFNVCSSNC